MKAKNIFLAALTAFALVMSGCGKGDEGNNLNPGGGNGGGSTSSKNFTISVSDITASCVNVTVSPKNNVNSFYFDVIECSEYDSYSDPQVLMEEYIAELQQLVEEWADYGLTFEDMLSSVTDSYYYVCALTPETNYYAFAVGVAANGTITTNPEVKKFTTSKVKASSNTFSIALQNDYLIITPSIESEYYLYNIYSGALDSATASDATIINAVLENAEEYGLDYFLGGNGENEFDFSGEFTNGQTYTAVVFGYDGAATTAVTRLTFTYDGSGSAGGGGNDGGEDGEVYIGISNLSANKNITIIGAEAYYYGDYYGTSTENWTAYFFSSEEITNTTDIVVCEFFSKLGAKSPAGSYTIDYDTLGNAGNAMPGFMDAEGYTLGTWYMNGGTTSYAASESGSFSITASGSKYNVNVEFVDVEGYTVKASGNNIDIYVGDGNSEAYAVAMSTGRGMFRKGAIRVAAPAKKMQSASLKPVVKGEKAIVKKVSLR